MIETRSRQFVWLMLSISQSILIAYRPDFGVVGQTQSHTIAWPSKLYVYCFFLFIGSPVPVRATYAWIMDTNHSGVCHC